MLRSIFQTAASNISDTNTDVCDKQFYLVDLKLIIIGANTQEHFIPGAFEVDGVDQHQLGHFMHHSFGHHIFDFTW